MLLLRLFGRGSLLNFNHQPPLFCAVTFAHQLPLPNTLQDLNLALAISTISYIALLLLQYYHHGRQRYNAVQADYIEVQQRYRSRTSTIFNGLQMSPD
jgi:hypothetical protein